MFIRFRNVFSNFVRKIFFDKYQNSTSSIFLLLSQGIESNPARERFELFFSLVFEHHVSETHIISKANSHSSNSAFKFSKLRFILRILTCRTLSFSKYCVLRRYGFTSFGLKCEVSKLDLVISQKNLCNTFYSAVTITAKQFYNCHNIFS